MTNPDRAVRRLRHVDARRHQDSQIVRAYDSNTSNSASPFWKNAESPPRPPRSRRTHAGARRRRRHQCVVVRMLDEPQVLVDVAANEGICWDPHTVDQLSQFLVTDACVNHWVLFPRTGPCARLRTLQSVGCLQTLRAHRVCVPARARATGLRLGPRRRLVSGVHSRRRCRRR